MSRDSRRGRVVVSLMATDLAFVEYVQAQTGLGDRVSHRRMFGEFALYLDGKTVALVCDNQLFVKPTEAGRALLGKVSLHSPFPQAKPYFRIDAELDEPERLAALLRVTADALPAPKAKRAKPGR